MFSQGPCERLRLPLVPKAFGLIHRHQEVLVFPRSGTRIGKDATLNSPVCKCKAPQGLMDPLTSKPLLVVDVYRL